MRAADSALDLLTRPREAAALALAAYRVAPTTQSRDALLLARAAGAATTLGSGYLRVPGSIAVTQEFGPDPGLPGNIRLWAGPEQQRGGGIPVPPNGFLNLISADERTAVMVVDRDEFQLWDLSDPAAPRITGTMTDWPFPLGIDAAGTLMTAVEDGGAVHWRPGDATRTRLPVDGVEYAMPLDDGDGVVLARRDDDLRRVEVWSSDGRVTPVFSRDARLSLVTGPGSLLAVSDRDDAHLTVLDGSRTLLEADGIPEAAVVEFSRNGHAVTAVHRDSVWLWDLTGGEPLSLRAPGVEFSFVRYEHGELLMVDTRGALWRLTVDVDQVIRDVCLELVDVDWAAHFPGVAERPLCP
jgi:hypothetical protein